MGRQAAGDVVFDYDGALTLARRLWTFADSLDTVIADRETLAVEALTSWKGTHGTSFATRMATERTDTDTASLWLRAGAEQWAAAWKDAMDEQNRVLFSRECQRRKDDAAWHERGIAGGIFGGPDMPDEPGPVSLPTPPGFAATDGLVSY